MTPERCPWYLAGPIIGLVIVGLRATLNKPLGALGGYIDLAENAITPRRLGFRSFLLLGIVLGGVAYAFTLGHFSPAFSYANAAGAAAIPPYRSLGLLLLAGFGMGFGARVAGGCTSGHGMTGMSLLSPASILASMTFFTVAVALARLFSVLSFGLPFGAP
jgi:uncharacterized membrane protein YedE/YeeE